MALKDGQGRGLTVCGAGTPILHEAGHVLHSRGCSLGGAGNPRGLGRGKHGGGDQACGAEPHALVDVIVPQRARLLAQRTAAAPAPGAEVPQTAACTQVPAAQSQILHTAQPF